MIIGTGIDIVNIERIEHLMSRWGSLFLGRVFTEKEIAWCQHRARNNRIQRTFVTLSHDRPYAVAHVLLEEKNDESSDC